MHPFHLCPCFGEEKVAQPLTPANGLQPPMILVIEAVEKVPEQILGRDAEKSDPIECATINDLTLGRSQETPENLPLIVRVDFFYRLVRRG